MKDWFLTLSKFSENKKINSIKFNGYNIKKKNEIPICTSSISNKQKQTEKVFDFKWHQTSTYKNPLSKSLEKWLKTRYKSHFFSPKFRNNPTILDAGCGSGLSSLLLFGKKLKKAKYLGIDVSNSVEVARDKFKQFNFESVFMKCDLNKLPLYKNSIDLVFSEGVLHHTDDPFKSLRNITKFLKKNGIIMFYIYKRKSAIREFCDKYIRDKLKSLSPRKSWEKLKPITEIGIELGKINKTININKDIDLLGIPKGKISVQRLFYWYIFKCYYDKKFSFNEMHHINYDWYSPQNASTHTKEEVKKWCKKVNLSILNFEVDNAGISVIAKK